MIENLVKTSTCQVICGNELGTGFLVAEKLILTARHCVLDAIEKNTTITLTFSGPSGEFNSKATIVKSEEALDVCLLSISDLLELHPIELDTSLPREGSDWYSFGYPTAKISIGHRFSGVITQTLESPKLKVDIDLAIEASDTLINYGGLSGAAIICEGTCRGMIRLKLDGSLGAISIRQLQEFLEKNGVTIKSDKRDENYPFESGDRLAERRDFQLGFEKLLLDNPGSYLFLEGAHGIGKTTFCKEFIPVSSSLLVLGTYSFTSRGHGAGSAQRIQPNAFFDWLATSLSNLVSGKSARMEKKQYETLVQEIDQQFKLFSEFCNSKKCLGILFIDGLDEALAVGEESFSLFRGLLPSMLPSGVSVVLTAPNRESIAAPLSGILDKTKLMSLPLLDSETEQEYCFREIRSDRANVSLINIICTKAQGHPLYLRYLIEYVNNEPEDIELEEFPVFEGSISIYYEQLWSRLLVDQEAVNFLAIISRLRWGIAIDDIQKILNEAELTTFIPTLSRIRHLLLSPDQTTIYHSSFSDFLVMKTAQLGPTIENRLAEFCTLEVEIEYCVLNLVFHLLYSGESGRIRAVENCTQNWVDQCVTLGVEPDTLLFDIEETLASAVASSPAVEVVRILLLSQRINFRYNTLFAESAQLIAEALIALKQPRDALQHIIRFDTLLVSPNESLQVAFLLIKGEFPELAMETLTLLYDRISEELNFEDLTIHNFITFSEILIHCLLFMELADGNRRLKQVSGILNYAVNVIRSNIKSNSKESLPVATEGLLSIIPSFYLCFQNQFTNLSKMRQLLPDLPENILDLLINTLQQCLKWLDSFKLPKNHDILQSIFSDIETLIEDGSQLNSQKISGAVDILILLGAKTSIVQDLANQGDPVLPRKTCIISDNGVDVDYRKIYQAGSKWRAAAFLDDITECPTVDPWTASGWLQSLEALTQILFWCEGKARRAKAEENEELHLQTLEHLNTKVLTTLTLSLAQRAQWDNSYAIPEKVFPILYEIIVELYIDCYPMELQSLLHHISDQMNHQCGLYSEGYRKVMYVVARDLSLSNNDSSLSNQVFELLQRWKSYVISNVKNRYELVPELLRLIPLFINVGADEIAKRIYQNVLDVSMGPGWYKEDQLGLMNSVLKSIPVACNVQTELPQIAGLLEHSSGEMTFERFVRYEKAALIGELFRRGKPAEGSQYFKRLTCGTISELHAEACRDEMDRLAPMIGMRYPGGALDEQDAILQIVSFVQEADWQLSWALLEIYQFGDDRYLNDYAKLYAKLINSKGFDSKSLLKLVDRINFNLGSELNSNQRIEFLEAFHTELDSEYHQEFPDILEPLSDQDSSNQLPTLTKTEEKTDTTAGSKDELYLPGTFGRNSAMKEADVILEKAEAQLARENIKAAKQKAAQVLRTYQDGGWSIWGNLSSTARRADEILKIGTQNADEIVHLYAPLLINESYRPRWVLAEHLISKVTEILSEEERSSLTQCVMDHIQLIVGDATDEIEAFSFLGKNQHSNCSTELLDLILWLSDHPQWLRREKAADLLVWLLESETTYYRKCINQAFSMDVGFRAEIICGVLDGLSIKQPLNLWKNVEPHLNLDIIFRNCQHISRLTVLHRIAERAGLEGSESASSAAAKIFDQFHPEITDSDLSKANIFQPIWANCIKREWIKLRSIGVIHKEFVSLFEDKMVRTCSPLNIETAWALEKILSKGFRENENTPLNRWEAKVRFALNAVLFRYASQQNFTAIEAALRIFNPSALWLTRMPNFDSPSRSIIDSIYGEGDHKNCTGNNKFLFLNYQETIEHKSSGQLLHLEVTAVMTSEYSGYQPQPPTPDSIFGSRELLDTSRKTQSYETCYRVEPDLSFLGTFTPGIPTDNFMKLIKANDNDFFRVNWSNGRSQTKKRQGRAMNEGCLLSVKRGAVRLPPGFGLSWYVFVEGKLHGIISQ